MIIRDFSLEMLLKEMENAKILNSKEERELIRRARTGDKNAMEELVKSNLRYIYNIALKYANYGIPLSDLIMEGSEALVLAIKKFDLRKKVRLLTYATYYIENAMQKLIAEQSHSLKTTLDYREKLRKILKTIEEFKRKEGREPTLEELSKILNLKPENIRETLNQYRGEFSIDEVNEEDNRTKEEIFEDPHQNFLKEEIEKEINLEKAINLMKRVLDEREFKVIVEYYGIGCERKTFEELAKELNITKERVRQIKENAIRKLRFYFS
ncbi:MAG: sigma-70 family RNA polymerase sigma factor [candidate division WOR-3 bacterium]